MLALFAPEGLDTSYDGAPSALTPQQIMVRKLVEQDGHSVSFAFYDDLMALPDSDGVFVCHPTTEALKALEAIEATLQTHAEDIPKFYHIRLKGDGFLRSGDGQLILLQGKRYLLSAGWGYCIAFPRGQGVAGGILDLSQRKEEYVELEQGAGGLRPVTMEITQQTASQYYHSIIERLKHVCATSPSGWICSCLI
jgi:hypothetical protein